MINTYRLTMTSWCRAPLASPSRHLGRLLPCMLVALIVTSLGFYAISPVNAIVGELPMTVSYSIVGGGTPTPPVFWYWSYGTQVSLKLSNVPRTVLADFGSAWTLDHNPLLHSTSTNSWYYDGPDPTAGTVSAPAVYSWKFYHMTLQTVSVDYPEGGVTGSHRPHFNFYYWGYPYWIYLTHTPTGYWCDHGSKWTVTPNPTDNSGTTERWISSNVLTGTIAGPATRVFTYEHQFYLTMQAVPAAAGTVSPGNGWHTKGTTIHITEKPNAGHVFIEWIGTDTGGYWQGSWTKNTWAPPWTGPVDGVIVLQAIFTL
jgi:hypothetical protein